MVDTIGEDMAMQQAFKTTDLAPDERAALERLLGRPLQNEEAVEVITHISKIKSLRGTEGFTTPGSPPGFETEFKAHVEKWRKDTRHTSSLATMTAQPSYRRIMGMGREVL